MKKNELKIELRSEEIFPNGFSLEDFEKFFEENQNIIKNNMKNHIKNQIKNSIKHHIKNHT